MANQSCSTEAGRQPLSRWVLVTLLTGAALGLACPRPGLVVAPAAEPVEMPKGVFLPEGTALAFRVGGERGTTLRDVELPLAPLLSRGVEAPMGFYLYTRSNGRHRTIAHRRQGDKLIADLPAGRTYIVAPRMLGWPAHALTALCRWKREPRIVPDAVLPKICTRILCAPELITERKLFEGFGLPPRRDGLPPMEFGGWDVIPRDLCDLCTRPVFEVPDLGAPVFGCLFPSGSGCGSGQVLFDDDFEADTVGSAPATSPAGPPPGDSLAVSGDVEVVAAASKAARLRRRSSQPAVLEAVLDTGATSGGSYCIRFTASATGFAGAPLVVTFDSTTGADAWLLVIDEDSAELSSGAASAFVVVDDFTSPHEFRFDVDLDLRTFDMSVDGNPVATGQSLLDASFGIPEKLSFTIGTCLLECFDSSGTVDDIVVSKTN